MEVKIVTIAKFTKVLDVSEEELDGGTVSEWLEDHEILAEYDWDDWSCDLGGIVTVDGEPVEMNEIEDETVRRLME